MVLISFKCFYHYPKYTMKDYYTMPEWQLDRPVHNDLAYKREFVMGVFLWPNFQ